MNIASRFLRVSLFSSAILLLAACGKHEEAPLGKPASAGAVTEVTPSGGDQAGESAVQVKLQGGDIHVASFLVLRGDRQTTTAKSQRPIRRIALEAGPGSVEEILQQTGSAIREAGYRPGKVAEDRGGLRQNFRKDGVDLVRVLVRPLAEGRAPRNPAATVRIDISELGNK